MPARSLQWKRHFFAGWRAFWKKPLRNNQRQRLVLELESLEARVTPTAGVQEQYMLDLINRFRENPTAELSLILNANDPNVNEALAYFNVDKTALAAQFATLTPAPPLAWNDDLETSALGHSQAMLTAQDQAHQVPGELDPWTRMVNAGYVNYTYLAENIYAYASGIFVGEAAFVIDWGDNPPTGIQSPAGHRENLLDPGLREVGIGLVNAPSGSPMGPLLITQDFGNRTDIGNPFLLGNVYDDLNSDGFYEPGEGLSGVNLTITGNGGTFQTTTTAAGGYQLQIPAGTYQITASGGGLVSPLVKNVIIASDNIQVDFIKPAVVAPAAPNFMGIGGTTTNTTPGFSWTATTGATQYYLQITNGQNQQILNQTVTANTFTPTTPLSAGSYQAWVRVTTGNGTSSWSAPYSFTINPPPIPTLIAPTGSTPNLSPTFTWTASTNADHYDLYVTNLTTNQAQIIRQKDLTTTSYTPSTHLPLGSYQAWVQAFNNAGNSAGWSTVLNFLLSAPSPPTITAPAADITNTTPTFSWTASTGATQYDVWADNNTTGQSQVVRQIVNTTSYTPANAIPLGQYTLWVRAANSGGSFGPWTAGYHFLIDNTAPAIPTITGPTTTANVKPTFTWSNSAGAMTYDLWVNDLTTNQIQIIRQQTLSSNSFTSLTNLPIGSYAAWVQAFDNTHQTRGWSAAYYFNIVLPAAPTQLSPVGSITNTIPTFTWNAIDGAAYYDLWVDDVSASQKQLIRQQTLPTNSLVSPITLAKGSYRFWVRAFNANGNAGNWSAEIDFTVG